MGGEKATSSPSVLPHSGSPPRGRGKGHGCHQTAVVVGITPAWAGKRSQVAAALQSGWDHPRIGGEKNALSSGLWPKSGSPPRRRGKGTGFVLDTGNVGITPAWAGKSPTVKAAGRVMRDHPRVGGEKTNEKPQHGRANGSPPRGRGKDLGYAYKGLRIGITPAWAGKSIKIGMKRRAFGDHPRVGGEK